MSSSVRDYVLEQLAPGIPAGDVWKVEPGIPTIKTLAKPVLWLEYTTFEREPTAPMSHLACGVDVCIATNLTDQRKGEDEADELVAALFESIVTSASFRSASARKAIFGDTYIGWRISLTVITKRPEPAPEPEPDPEEE
jgi:hypothetical protein